MTAAKNSETLNPWPFTIGAGLVARLLSQDLYKDIGACLWELVKNALCACMPDPRQWTPEKAHIELSLVPSSPLSPRSYSLVAMDRGSGFTEQNIQRFCRIGPDEMIGMSRHGGAAQKQIGRFAYFGLNTAITQDNDLTSGFHILTRTSASGPVTMITITPKLIAEGSVMPRLLSPDASELGVYRGIKGSFSIIVIPNAAFSSEDEIRRSIEWRLPRLRDKAIKILVGGKPVKAPPLASKTAQYHGISAHIDRAPADNGVWLSDANTGIRCAFAPTMVEHLPYPLGRTDLEGDLFIPGLLQHQTTDRAALTGKFLRSKEWRTIFEILQLHMAPFAKQLLGDDDVMDDNDPNQRSLQEIESLFADCWGDSKLSAGDLLIDTPRPPKPPRSGVGGGGEKTGRDENPPRPRLGYDDDPATRQRAKAMLIDGQAYVFQRYPTMPPNIYVSFSSSALVDQDKKRKFLIIQQNPNYAIQLKPAAQLEHLIDQILITVASNRSKHNSQEAIRLAAKFRADLESSRKDRKKSKR